MPGLDVSSAFGQRINLSGADSIRYGDEHVERLVIRGTQPDYAYALPLFSVAYGRFISPFDEEHARNVVVIGSAIADSLFPHSDPIGKPVRLNGRGYEVIGVFEKDPGLFGGFGVDQFACIPHVQLPQELSARSASVFLLFTVREDADLDTVRDQVTEVPCGGAAASPAQAENDFEVADPELPHHPVEPAHRRAGAADRR